MSLQPRNTLSSKMWATLNLWVRSSIFAVFSLTGVIFWSTVIICSWVLPLRTRHLLVRSYLKFYLDVLKWLCHVDYQVIGLENVPKDRVGVVLSKHQSAWETFFLPTVFHAPAVILKRELYLVPFFGWALAASDPIAINRNNRTSAMQQVIKKGAPRLAAGRWIIVFPEGTRTPYGKVGHYKLGGARLAVETGYPVIPVAHNAGKYWPKKSFLKYPGTVRVVIGPMIETKNRTPEEVMAEVQAWIEGQIQRMD